jgi:hypothetical protein
MPAKGHVPIEKTGMSLTLQQLLSFLCTVIRLAIATVAIASSEPGAKEISTAASVASSMFVGGLTRPSLRYTFVDLVTPQRMA